MARWLQRLILLIGLSWVHGGQAWAASCAIDRLAQLYDELDVVFIGVLLEARLDDEQAWDGMKGTFKVIEMFKGTPVSTFKVATSAQDSMGGLEMTIGRLYLVFATADGKVSMCTAGQINSNEKYRAWVKLLREGRITDE